MVTGPTSMGHYIQGGITIQPIWYALKYIWLGLSSEHSMYSDSRTWVQ